MVCRSAKKLVLLLALVALVMSAAVFPGCVSAAREETVDARGIAPYTGRKDIAREQALAEAFRQAVRQAVGVMVESESLVQNQILVTDQVLSHSSGFIKKYCVTSETLEDGVYQVDIRATVSETKLKRALSAIGVTARKMGKPKIMLVITESSGEGDPAGAASGAGWGNGVAESAIHGILIGKGFDLVERRALSPARAQNPGALLTPEALARLAKSGEVQILFIGTASSRSTPLAIAGTSLHSCQATVSVKAVNADNGEVLASHTARAAAPHINTATGEAEALGKAAGEVAERLSQQVMANWTAKLEGTRSVRLVVSGLGGYDDLKSFKALLREHVEELEEIFERSFDANTAKLDLELTPSSADLADQLSTLSLEGRAFNITSFTPNVIQLTIGTKKRGTK